MDHRFTRTDGEPKFGMPSEGFVETMLETLITLAAAAAICISMVSLAAHLNEVRVVRSAAAATAPAGMADIGPASSTSHLN
jgi:hypothetical protein